MGGTNPRVRTKGVLHAAGAQRTRRRRLRHGIARGADGGHVQGPSLEHRGARLADVVVRLHRRMKSRHLDAQVLDGALRDGTRRVVRARRGRFQALQRRSLPPCGEVHLLAVCSAGAAVPRGTTRAETGG